MSYLVYNQLGDAAVGTVIKADRVKLLDGSYVFYDNSGNIVACFQSGQFLHFHQLTGDPPWSTS